jgi:pimeloyl-ACP methyl ester carboxylesterase
MTTFHTISIDGLDIFYREAGSRSNPTILLLHGFPTSSHIFRNLEAISPDTWNMDQLFLDRPGNDEIQLALLYSYGTNPPLYLQWQEYFRKYQPPTLIVWGKNDDIFPAEGAYPYKHDLKDVEFHLLDTGHFALEEGGDAIADHIRRFMTTHVGQSQD